MTKIKLEKILKVTLNGMSFRFKSLETKEQRVSCNNFCPLRNICDQLPNPEVPRDKDQRFLDFCGLNQEIENFFGGANNVPDMTESEARMMFIESGYEIFEKLPKQ